MSQVAMTINGRIYRLSCEDGEEERLMQLARDVAVRVDEFTNTFGQVGENRLLFLAAIRLADELLDAKMLLEKHTGKSIDAIQGLNDGKAATARKNRVKQAPQNNENKPDDETATHDAPNIAS